MHVEGDTETYRLWVLERLLNKRIIRRGRGSSTEYLARWQGWGPEHDMWINAKELDHAPELIDAYEENANRNVTANGTPIMQRAQAVVILAR